MEKTCVIIGASHAAAQLVVSLRSEGWTGPIVIVSEENDIPYHRPTLSKAFLSGAKTKEQIFIRPVQAYAKLEAEFLFGIRVEEIDRGSKTLTLNNGETLHYDKLAICTGARARMLSIPGANLDGVCYLRSAKDAEHIKTFVKAGAKAVIVGGGYIGLETAASLTTLGMDVTVLEAANRVLERVTCAEMSTFFSRVHNEEGVSIHTDVQVKAFKGEDHVDAVVCADGTEYSADLVVVGIGIIPNTEIAQACGLLIDNGVVTNEYALTNDPSIVACGDCANHPNSLYQRRLRLESVPNACDQAKSAAASLCNKQKVYDALPWFWSDQYDIKLQMVGLNQGFDETVVRGDINGRRFAVFYFKQGVLIAADCVNCAKEFMVAKQLVTRKSVLPSTMYADESQEIKQLLTM